MKKDLLELNMEEMKAFAAEQGEKPFRGKQIFQWIYRGASSFEEMSDLSKDLRQRLAEVASLEPVNLAGVQEDPKDGTKKFLFQTVDGELVEGVFLQYGFGNTMCVSSQVGCRMGCAFCASALGGFVRNLTAGEMMGQILTAQRYAGEKIDHMVLMGMGEPLDNWDQVSRFLRLLHERSGKNMSWRNMTVSTSGIIPGIRRLGEEFPQVNLAISLHRPDDEGRSRLMPVNRAYPLEDLIAAAREHGEKTGRRITFEYALIDGENDRPEDIRRLKQLLSGMLCHVNLIPLNEVEETGLKGSTRIRAEEIAEELIRSGVPATVRRKLGEGIEGACGQLRRRTEKKG